MDAEVYWYDRLVGYLCGVTVDQPYYHGAWVPAGDPGFDRAYRVLQARVAPDGLGMLPVMLRTSDGAVSVPAAVMVRPYAVEPYFRFGGGGSDPVVVHEPWRDSTLRDCERCGRPISSHRLRSVPEALRCWDCQTEIERQG